MSESGLSGNIDIGKKYPIGDILKSNRELPKGFITFLEPRTHIGGGKDVIFMKISSNTFKDCKNTYNMIYQRMDIINRIIRKTTWQIGSSISQDENERATEIREYRKHTKEYDYQHIIKKFIEKLNKNLSHKKPQSINEIIEKTQPSD